MRGTIVHRNYRRENLWGWLMILPALIFFLVFVFYPAVSTFVLSVFRWDMLTERVWAGMSNFVRLFLDARLGGIVKNTLIFAVISVVLKIGIALMLAVLVFRVRSKRITALLEGIFFFPLVIPMSIIAMVFTPVSYTHLTLPTT